MAERGQASVELVAAVPGVLLAAVLCLQLATGYSLTLADGAAEAGAIALASGISRSNRQSRRRCRADRRPGRGRRRGRAVDGPTASTVAVGVGRASARGQLDRLGPASGGRRLRPLLILSSELAGAGGGLATAAAVAVELAKPDARLGGQAVLLAELAGEAGAARRCSRRSPHARSSDASAKRD